MLSSMAAQSLQMGTETVQLSAERLTQAAFLEEKALEALHAEVLKEHALKYPEPGKPLYRGVMFKEGHVNTNFESRYFRLRLDDDWTPILTYAKPESQDQVIAEFHCKSFTFVPTKQGRKEHSMTWRLDATGVSVGKSKHDKLVIAFKNPRECQLWQAAFNMCKAPQKFAELMKRKEIEEENARLAAVKAEQDRIDREREAKRQADLELAIAQSILKNEAQEAADKAAAAEEEARLVLEKEQREADEARERMMKEQAEAEEALRILEKEAAEAEAARVAMLKEEQEAEEARLAMEKEAREAEEAKAQFDKEQAEFIAAAADHAKEFAEAEAAFKKLEALRALLLDARQRGVSKEIDDLQAQVAAAEKEYEREAAEAKEALQRMQKEKQEADEARARHEKEQREAEEAAAAHAKEEREAEEARGVYRKEEAERVDAQGAYEKEKAEADFASSEYEREAAEADAARATHAQKQKESGEAKAVLEQREKEMKAEQARVAAAKGGAAAKPAGAAADPELVKAAQAFVTEGGILNKYMREKLVNGKVHEPHPKTVKMNGSCVTWDKKSFTVANAKLGGSMLLRANSTGEDLDCNFYMTLSGVPGGQEALDLRAPSKDVAEKWVMGVLACIGKL